jgi:aminoglycoside phosphotransferase (APT) family kinase protein
MAEQIRAWAADELGEPDVKIEGLRRTSAGFSRENWVFDAVHGDGRREALIARRDPVGSVLRTDRAVEGAVLRALEATNVPAPKVRWLDAEGTRLGRPTVVMERAEGECDWFVLNSDRPVETRVDIAHRLYDRLADIHLVDWRSLGLGEMLDDPGDRAAQAAVDHWEQELRAVQLEGEPELEVALTWLRASAPEAAATTLVHGDFKAGNVLLIGDEVSLVLDWETVHLGDPQEDLGWVTNPLRMREHRIEGVWEPDDLIARWAAQTGLTPHIDAIRWWRVLANFKLCVIVLTGNHAFVHGRLDQARQSPVSLYRLLLDMIGA